MDREREINNSDDKHRSWEYSHPFEAIVGLFAHLDWQLCNSGLDDTLAKPFTLKLGLKKSHNTHF